ncbi:hypothetical protein DVP34_00815 [Yersinia enterocolitica]|nr:hypothetical protein [Yersinia enterocolitica]EKN6328090.1 hypothetical protein [Yersinia enterocolitica]EKN6373772.1 hypothetical protein [Yersinia enterocolitica]
MISESGLRTISMKIKSPQGGFFFACRSAKSFIFRKSLYKTASNILVIFATSPFWYFYVH